MKLCKRGGGEARQEAHMYMYYPFQGNCHSKTRFRREAIRQRDLGRGETTHITIAKVAINASRQLFQERHHLRQRQHLLQPIAHLRVRIHLRPHHVREPLFRRRQVVLHFGLHGVEDAREERLGEFVDVGYDGGWGQLGFGERGA